LAIFAVIKEPPLSADSITIVASDIPATILFLLTNFLYRIEPQNSVIKPPFCSTLDTYFYGFSDKFGLNRAPPTLSSVNYVPLPVGATISTP
jgi:hypothetical protein